MKKTARFGLAQKALIIMVAVLSMEMVFLGGMAYLLSTAEKEAREAEKLAHSFTEIYSLTRLYFNIFSTFLEWQVGGSHFAEENYNRSVAEFPRRLARLRLDLSDHPELIQELFELEVAVNKGIKLTEDNKGLVARRGPLGLLSLRKKGAPIFKDLHRQQDKLKDVHEKLTKNLAAGAVADFRAKMIKVLWLGVGLNIAMFVVVILLFSRQITGRLSIMEENVKRLKIGEGLLPEVKGGDEIGRLDSAFHETARALDKAMTQLTASEKRTRSIIDNMPVGLVTTAEGGQIKSINPETARLFEFNQSELEDRDFADLFSGPDGGQKREFDELKKRGFKRVYETKARRKDGNFFPVELSLSEFESDDGERYLANILDVSERHEMEKMKRQFVAMVSHDLMTPLTSVTASLALISSGALGETSPMAEKAATRAARELERLQGLVMDLLDAAKLESGKLDVKFENVEFDRVLRRSGDSVRLLAENKKIKLKIEKSEAKIEADGNRLIQVLINLVSNAIKFSPEGGTITVKSGCDNGWLDVEVIDQGPGVSAELQKKIFERFEQTQAGKDAGGTGLGLAICKDIVELHDGEIGVKSDEKTGSTFWFRIPVSQGL